MRDRDLLWLLIVDITGGVCVAALLLSLLWLTLLRSQSPASTIETLSGSVAELRTDLGKMKTRRKEQEDLVAARRAEMTTIGAVPGSIAINEYFNMLARRAAEYGLEVRRQNPLSSQIYPGLREQRYSYEVAGSLTGLAGFLQSIEDAEVWADVGFLRISADRGPKTLTDTPRTAQLTISLFTSPPATTKPIGGQG